MPNSDTSASQNAFRSSGCHLADDLLNGERVPDPFPGDRLRVLPGLPGAAHDRHGQFLDGGVTRLRGKTLQGLDQRVGGMAGAQ